MLGSESPSLAGEFLGEFGGQQNEGGESQEYQVDDNPETAAADLLPREHPHDGLANHLHDLSKDTDYRSHRSDESAEVDALEDADAAENEDTAAQQGDNA